ncbi:MAG: hypothetical protein RLN88_11370 [Ekhidna sp.]|uniref:hypothetical protein n=1 Tax=Ekhidna sp. TaxID=2608089 RepID=UPI0032EC257C
MSKSSIIIEETNLSVAWCKTVNNILSSSGTNEITPLLISLTGFDENEEVRQTLDKSLKKNGQNPITTVAETIFPDSLYRYLDEDRFELYKEYTKNLPRIMKIDQSNRKGTYFGRLISYGNESGVNQLEIIISSVNKIDGVKRRSKLQASVFDPTLDHINSAYQGFPCLQHVTFYKSDTGGIILNSFYAIQLLYRKAYGNWLGLVNLGKFIAKETGCELDQVNCFIGIEKLEIAKSEAKKLLEETELELSI